MAASRSKLEERSGQPWTLREVTRLEELTAWNAPASETGAEFGRSEDAVRAKARSENVSLSTTSTPSDGANQSTYRRVLGVAPRAKNYVSGQVSAVGVRIKDLRGTNIF